MKNIFGLGFYLCLYLGIFLLECNDKWIQIELKKEIINYDKILLSLFNLEVRKKGETIFIIKGNCTELS